MKGTVLCAGMMTCDSYYYDLSRDALALPNSVCTKVRMSAGGDATNVSIDLARMGIRTRIAGLIGEDFHGDGILKTVREAGVDTSFVTRRENVTTTMTLILYTDEAVDASDRHCIRNQGGNSLLTAEDVPEEAFDGADHLHYGSFGPLTSLDGESGAKLLARARAKGLTTSLDTKGLGRDLAKLELMLPYVDYFLPNIEEAADLTGLSEPSAIRDYFLSRGVGCLCLTMAEKGVYLADRKEEIHLPALIRDQSAIVDIMGAGDAFCAGMIAATLLGLPLRDKGLFASLCSKHALTSAGASAWITPADELLKELRQIKETL